MIEWLFYLLVLIAGIPTGILISYLCKEEINNWKKKLKIISVTCPILVIIILFIPADIFQYKTPVIITLLFIIIMNLSIIKINFKYNLKNR